MSDIIRWLNEPIEPRCLGEPDRTEQEHNYEWVDTSFDHAFGTQSEGFYECECGHRPNDKVTPHSRNYEADHTL